MTKLNRAVDVATVLSNRNLSPKGISIKPDLSKEDRQRESLLLGERWKLIQSDVDKKLIKIKSSTIYVQGRKHAQVINNSLQFFDQPVQPDCSDHDIAQAPVGGDTRPNVTVPQSTNL